MFDKGILEPGSGGGITRSILRGGDVNRKKLRTSIIGRHVVVEKRLRATAVAGGGLIVSPLFVLSSGVIVQFQERVG